MMQTAQITTVPRVGETGWERYCGFLNRSLEHFLYTQEVLLMRQLDFIHGCGLWNRIVGDAHPQSLGEFRRVVPLTTYEDYREIFMEKQKNMLPAKVKVWAQTTGTTGALKLVPYTHEFYKRHGEFLIAAAALSSAPEGDMPLQAGDAFFCTVAPPPYASGLAVKAALEKLGLIAFPPFGEAEAATFTQRILSGFMMALEEGRIDAIGGVASVLVNIGKMFEKSIGGYLNSGQADSEVKQRMLAKYLEARSQDRPMRPKDFFNPRVILCAGSDVSLFADAVEEYWGRRPSECYAMTEVGQFAVQPFGCSHMVFMPNLALLEFIPESTYNENQPATVLLDEVAAGERYEPVITSFHEGCFLRYRTGDLIEVVSLTGSALGIELPMIRFYSRAEDIIDFPGVLRLNEKACWRLIEETRINYTDWLVKRTVEQDKFHLHFYIESFEPKRRIIRRLRKAASRLFSTFEEAQEVFGYEFLSVTVLKEGVFARYRDEMEAEGAELGKIKPVHINPGDAQLERIMRIDSELKRST
jgi:phenylacetate-coenzyme A ligase PaaK-like adenylate-forming protein